MSNVVALMCTFLDVSNTQLQTRQKGTMYVKMNKNRICLFHFHYLFVIDGN